MAEQSVTERSGDAKRFCAVPGCEKPARSRSSGICEMHYYRQRRTGRLDLVPRARPETTAHTGGYLLLLAPGHPLETPGGNGRVYEHRTVYHAEHGEGPFRCHWCGKLVTWGDMHVDHLNDQPDDNRLENLVASCPACNQKRGVPKMRQVKRKSGRLLTAHGKTMCVSEWARELGVSRAALQYRLENGWSVERALSEPRGKYGPKSQAEPRQG